MCEDKFVNAPELQVEGRLTRMVGLTLEAVGCQVNIGERCLVTTHQGTQEPAEVVGFSDDKIYLMPTGDIQGLGPGAAVIPTGKTASVAVGEELLGRVLDGYGNPLDFGKPLNTKDAYPLQGKPINPLRRHPIDAPLDVGVAAINALLTVGRGQRMGLFAGSGVGKSVLLGMMTRFTSADVIVVGLIGERGREVQEFIEHILGEEGRKRAVVVAVPADNSPLMRLQGAMVATSIAEYFRDKGKNVLLLMDSLTRFCQAQREIALAIGEPPATKGYPPSVFAKLPQLVERAGNAEKGGGSITAFYTVLAEGDDQQDPIADAARAILDGHVVLSRDLADEGHYPAIDIEQSVSRAITQISEDEHLFNVRALKRIYATFMRNRDLINIGAYERGSDREIDEAIALMPQIRAFLQQNVSESRSMSESLEGLQDLLNQVEEPPRQAMRTQ
ncbi:flagellar protein export ATPase FliI [Pleionea litopenaei]|uniref:Flagellum-specific ATP synthase n=1 Tax=Pleionea litopenaei TaxID=3070815 RepID=A0AA51RX98_9GAMM|nr:flagellar protein export ATPase FliI [Pleionea sp. HL-JVS1]WMS89265.1 flagellar protein export ATPase FliI [Pleionea sp. HL-JVS1]